MQKLPQNLGIIAKARKLLRPAHVLDDGSLEVRWVTGNIGAAPALQQMVFDDGLWRVANGVGKNLASVMIQWSDEARPL